MLGEGRGQGGMVGGEEGGVGAPGGAVATISAGVAHRRSIRVTTCRSHGRKNSLPTRMPPRSGEVLLQLLPPLLS